MKTPESHLPLLRVLWLAVIAIALLTVMTFTTAIADGSTGGWPDEFVDSTDSTDSTYGYSEPDTLSVIKATQSGTATTIYLELWGLLF